MKIKLRKNNLIWISIALISFYFISYVAMSRQGHYEPEIFGLTTGPNGEAIMSPKIALSPYYWHPFELHNKDGNLTFRSIFYFPLVKLDRSWFHQPRKTP